MDASSPTRSLDPAQVVVDAFRPVIDEVEASLEVVDGAVPRGLRGTLYRNGPGRLSVHGMQLTHPFDGDGMVSRFVFDDGQIRYRNRYVRTNEFRAEARAGRPLFRNFGTNLPGGLRSNLLRLRFKNPANTSVLYHGGRLLALWEGGQPHAIDPQTLDTIGRFDFEGRLKSTGLARWLAPEPPFSAHPRRCSVSGEVFNFGLQVAPRPTLRLYRIDPQGRLVSTRDIVLPAMAFMHDFVLTGEYAVFFVTPVAFDVARALLGLTSPVESIHRAPDAPPVALLVPRDGGPVRRIPLADGFFLFHFFNGFQADGKIVVDGCRMDDFPGGTVDLSDVESVRQVSLDPGFPTRWRIDPLAGRVDEERIIDVPMELPTIDRRRTARGHRYGYATARLRDGPPIYTGLSRIDFETGDISTVDLAPDLPGEPVFLPTGPAEADGVLATVVYRAEQRVSEMQLRDSSTLALVARARLPHAQPPGFHGHYEEGWVADGGRRSDL